MFARCRPMMARSRADKLSASFQSAMGLALIGIEPMG